MTQMEMEKSNMTDVVHLYTVTGWNARSSSFLIRFFAVRSKLRTVVAHLVLEDYTVEFQMNCVYV